MSTTPGRSLRRWIACGCLLTSLFAVPAAAQPARPGGRSVMLGHEQELQKNTHGIGLSAGVNGMFGFAYRRYFGNHAIQAVILPLMLDRGDYLSIRLGAQYVHYALLWGSAATRGRLVPSSTALRLVAAAGLNIVNESDVKIEVPPANCDAQCQKQLQPNEVKAEYSAAAGFGFEFGAIRRPGFSLSLDAMMTVLWDDEGFLSAYPLPYAALMYSW